MELLYANRDPLLEFSDTLAQWYGGLQTARREQRKLMRRPGGNTPLTAPPAGRPCCKAVFFCEVRSEDFLFKNKLVSSYWLHWSQLVHSVCADSFCDWLEGHSHAYQPLKQEAEILMCGPDPNNTPSPSEPLVSWRQYYEWRGLSLSSVVAPLLSSTLSIYYIITSLLPRQFPEMHILRKQSLRIHIIESYRESQTLVTFWELSVLLPHVTFDLVFVRERLPCWCDKMSELRCERSDQVMREATGGAVSRPTINPFHCPLRRNGGDNRLPRYSNGFIFHLMYKPSANRQPPVMDTPLSDLTSASLSTQRTFRERKAEQHWGREGKKDK
ncbi:hypothetical protein JOQ06_001323 [Pogonophryne albipinna]|uniref:Mitochondrial splicing suppressor 51-like C-terminal domain-containing protein n=1 Tax=Pogonophryne albipinna TaxID=1090488 RepID=A0AAD6B2K1_9TELE|nr:hypothetical protein JOQ06_001323 [Pogonophryne albipinna]